jgi:tetratricopeptide (TPR) repeat protein
MPRGDTEIPHIAFTHHRIGRHPAKAAGPSTDALELVPADDISHLSALDRQRNLGLAYVQAARRPGAALSAELLQERARRLLEGVQNAGLREGETSLALADIYGKRNPARSRAYAQQVLATKDTSVQVRALALMLLAHREIEEQKYGAALPLLEELVRLRRAGEDWHMLGICHLEQGQPDKALRALQQALAIQPSREGVHTGLAEVYRRLGDRERAQEHLDKARWLHLHRRD